MAFKDLRSMFKRTSNTDTTKAPAPARGVAIGLTDWCELTPTGYLPLAKNPEVMTGVNLISGLVSTMPIHLYTNTENGNDRVHNELAYKVDIEPNNYQTRSTFMAAIVNTLLLEGDGNAVIFPETRKGLLTGLHLLPPGQVSFVANHNDFGYKIQYAGKSYNPEDLIHICINPDPDEPWKGTGYRVPLKQVAESLNQANETKKKFMESKWMPTMIVRFDSLSDEMQDNEAKEELRKKYIDSQEKGEPWILPSEDLIQVETIKPLSLNDLAIKSSVDLDKKTVASLLGIPAFCFGEGNFSQQEWNNFINTKIRMLAVAIEQAFTKSLLIKREWFFKFSFRSLYSYDLSTIATVCKEFKAMGAMNGNEAREWIDMPRTKGLDEYTALENYIPVDKAGEQSKLTGGDGENGQEEIIENS